MKQTIIIRSIALAVILAIMPHQASAKSDTHPFSKATAVELTTVIGGCGGKRYRDPDTDRCRGPADVAQAWGSSSFPITDCEISHWTDREVRPIYNGGRKTGLP
jgi:hypothetical protein